MQAEIEAVGVDNTVINKKKVAIIDYGMGNIYSIMNAVTLSGGDPFVVSTASALLDATYAILPGVGAYPDAMNRLQAMGLDKGIKCFAAAGKPLLGICLGMQMLCKCSTENGNTTGLGLLDACVKRFPLSEGYTIPQIQWNKVDSPDNSILFNGVENNQFFYFLHGYYVCIEKTLTLKGKFSKSVYCNMSYCSALEIDNIVATQFHPEKSAELGQQILNNFLSFGD